MDERYSSNGDGSLEESASGVTLDSSGGVFELRFAIDEGVTADEVERIDDG